MSDETTREGLGKGLVELAKRDPRVVVLCADLTKSLRLTDFATQFPDRFIQVGIAEQNMISIAAGLAMGGKIPFACSYAAFSPGRTWDQIRVSVCYSKLNVKIVGGHTGLGVGENGAVHQAMEDIALTTVLPEMTVLSPADSQETYEAVLAAGAHVGPTYLRVSKTIVKPLPSHRPPFTIGKMYQLRPGTDIVLLSYGTLLSTTLEVAEQLADQQISAAVYAVPSLKPLDTTTLIKQASKYRLLVSIEEHQITGGLGSLIAPILLETSRRDLATVPQLLRIGTHDIFGESGIGSEVMAKYGLSTPAITKQIIEKTWDLGGL